MKAISDCLDTVGCFTRSVADAAFFVSALAKHSAPTPLAIGGLGGLGTLIEKPNIGICLTAQWS